MSRADEQVNFRIPAELVEQLRSAATENCRSLTKELVHRLQSTFEHDEISITLDSGQLERLSLALHEHMSTWAGLMLNRRPHRAGYDASGAFEASNVVSVGTADKAAERGGATSRPAFHRRSTRERPWQGRFYP